MTTWALPSLLCNESAVYTVTRSDLFLVPPTRPTLGKYVDNVLKIFPATSCRLVTTSIVAFGSSRLMAAISVDLPKPGGASAAAHSWSIKARRNSSCRGLNLNTFSTKSHRGANTSDGDGAGSLTRYSNECPLSASRACTFSDRAALH